MAKLFVTLAVITCEDEIEEFLVIRFLGIICCFVSGGSEGKIIERQRFFLYGISREIIKRNSNDEANTQLSVW